MKVRPKSHSIPWNEGELSVYCMRIRTIKLNNQKYRTTQAEKVIFDDDLYDEYFVPLHQHDQKSIMVLE